MRSTDAPGFGPAGWLLGVAFSGFFDGILLHQILQWHHLLSALEGRDLRFQIAADGAFHALMYVIAAAGLWLLWRSRGRPEASGRRLWADILIGFGAWNVADVGLFHWILGIHHVRMDSGNPVFWDVLWIVVFGLLPLAAGLAMRRRGGVSRSALSACIAALAVVGAAGWSALPPPENPFTTVLFSPDVSASEAAAAVAALDGRLVWTDASGQIVVYENSEARPAAALYARGALLVAGSGLPAGCFDWSRA